MKKKRYSLSAVLTAVILAMAVAISATMMIAMRYFNRQVNAVTQRQALYAHINDIDSKVRTYYSAIDEEQLRAALAVGYVNGLPDKYARYYSTAEYKQALLHRQGQASGVGLRLRTVEEQLAVDAVDAGSAAQKAGLQAGDVLVSVGGNAVTAKDRQSVQETLDTSTEKLTLSVLRDGKAMAFEMTAYVYQLKSVSEKMLNDSVGYIRITAFYDNTAAQFRAAYSSLEDKGAATFVFDLRGCCDGGSRDALESMLSYLMPHGAYATFAGSDGQTKNLVADNSHQVSGTTLTLVNADTCGEAELFAGILQEFSRTTVVGEKTAGKGKIQDFVPLQSNNSAILLTVGEITLMRGGSIEGVGVTPTVAAALEESKKAQIGLLSVEQDTQLQAALHTVNGNVTANTSAAATTRASTTAATSSGTTAATTGTTK